MIHEELRERLLDLAYGELSPRDARAVEDHAASCEACRAELARIRGTRALMARLPEEPAPEGGERILLAAAREAVRGREPRRGLPRWLWAAPIAAASVAVVVAISLRLGAVRPPPAREDPDALLGASRYAQAPPPPETRAPPAPTRSGGEDRGEAGTTASPPAAAATAAEAPRVADRAERARGQRAEREEGIRPEPRRAAPAPAPAAEPQRFATAPPPAPEASAAGASAALPPAASVPPPGPAAALRAPAAGAAAQAEASSELRERRAAKAAARDEAAPGDPAAEAVARYEALRREGRLRAEIRALPCAREPWRRVERDPDGRVVSFAREVIEAGRRLRLEAVYAADGSVARRRAVEVATGAPVPSPPFDAPRAADVDLDAPTLCDR